MELHQSFGIRRSKLLFAAVLTVVSAAAAQTGEDKRVTIINRTTSPIRYI
jgi:hypothetical protein